MLFGRGRQHRCRRLWQLVGTARRSLQGGDQHIVLAGAGAEITFDAANTPDPLAVGTTEHFIGDYLAQNPGVTVDYIHGAAAARAMAADPAKPATALLMPDFAQSRPVQRCCAGRRAAAQDFQHGPCRGKTLL